MVSGIFFSLIFLSDFLLLVYKNARDLGVLILHPVTLLNLLISPSNFLMVSLGFAAYHLQRVRVLLLLFQCIFLLFLFLL